jgi:gluconate 2-dehydrogenase gamma chain
MTSRSQADRDTRGNPTAVAGGHGLNERQRSTLGAITARLIPSDENGQGATEANVARYIERALASDYDVHRAIYASGLDSIDGYAVSRHGHGFAELTPEHQDALLAEVESKPADALSFSASSFFELVLQHTREGMFGDPSWGGNAGFVGWELIGYPGPRHEWSEKEQQLDVIVPPVSGCGTDQLQARAAE